MRIANKRIFTVFLSLILLSLACSLDIGNNSPSGNSIDQQTAVAQQITEAVQELELPSVDEQQVEQATTPNFVFQGISLNFDPSLAREIHPEEINQSSGDMPGETYPAHVELAFEGYVVDNHNYSPQILIYPVDEFRAISPEAASEIDALQQIIISKPDASIQGSLPFLPVWPWPGGQTFAVQVAYFNFQNGSGVRYLTAFRGDLYPLDTQDLLYTYQALSNDGRYVISAVLPITSPVLPADGASQVDDWQAFEMNWDVYLEEIGQALDSQEINSFLPDSIRRAFLPDKLP